MLGCSPRKFSKKVTSLLAAEEVERDLKARHIHGTSEQAACKAHGLSHFVPLIFASLLIPYLAPGGVLLPFPICQIFPLLLCKISFNSLICFLLNSWIWGTPFSPCKAPVHRVGTMHSGSPTAVTPQIPWGVHRCAVLGQCLTVARAGTPRIIPEYACFQDWPTVLELGSSSIRVGEVGGSERGRGASNFSGKPTVIT